MADFWNPTAIPAPAQAPTERHRQSRQRPRFGDVRVGTRLRTASGLVAINIAGGWPADAAVAAATPPGPMPSACGARPAVYGRPEDTHQRIPIRVTGNWSKS